MLDRYRWPLGSPSVTSGSCVQAQLRYVSDGTVKEGESWQFEKGFGKRGR